MGTIVNLSRTLATKYNSVAFFDLAVNEKINIKNMLNGFEYRKLYSSVWSKNYKHEFNL